MRRFYENPNESPHSGMDQTDLDQSELSVKIVQTNYPRTKSFSKRKKKRNSVNQRLLHCLGPKIFFFGHKFSILKSMLKYFKFSIMKRR